MKKSKIPGPQQAYTELIDEALLQKQEEKESYFPLRPSAAGYCERRLAYDLSGYLGHAEYPKEVKKPETLRLLDLGNSIEWHSIRNFELVSTLDPEFKVKYRQQTPTIFRLVPIKGEETGRLIEGSIDLAVLGRFGGGLGDVKSKKDKFHAAFKSDWDSALAGFDEMKSLQRIGDSAWYAEDLDAFLAELSDPFFVDNFVQLNCYLLSDWAKERDFDHGFIYRYCKNDSRHLEIRFSPSQKLFDYVEAKFNNVYKAVVQNQAPEQTKKEFKLGSSRCAFCPYSKECWSEDSLQAYFATFPKKAWPTKIQELPESARLEGLFKLYTDGVASQEEAGKAEAELCDLLVEKKINKVKFGNGEIYEVRYLKSPKPHFELRRSKI